MLSIAMTGATSMLGIALISECIKNNISVMAFVNPKTSKIGRIPDSQYISVIYKSLDELNDISDIKIKEKIDVFYHIAWSTGKINRHLTDVQIRNIEYTINAVRLAKVLGCKKFIGIGSQAEYGLTDKPLSPSTCVNPITAYGVAKYAAGCFAKIECAANELEFNWVRVLSIYGIYDKDESLIKTLINNASKNIPMNLSDCEQIWDYLNEIDAGRALFLIGEKGINNKIYCLGSGKGLPLKNYIHTIISAVNPDYRPSYGAIPYTDNSIKYLVADITDLKKDTGWKPKIKFEEGIKILTPPPRKINLSNYCYSFSSLYTYRRAA